MHLHIKAALLAASKCYQGVFTEELAYLTESFQNKSKHLAVVKF